MSTQAVVPSLADQMRQALLQRAQNAAPPPPMPIPINSMPQSMTPLPVPTAPPVTQAVDPAIAATQARTLGDQNELRRLTSSGSGIHQITNPVDADGNPTGAPVSGLRRFGGALARIGATAEAIVSPRAAAVTPGTDQNHERLMDQQTGQVNNDLANEHEQAGTTLLDAQPELKAQTLQNQMLYRQGILQHQSDVLDLGKEKAHEAYLTNLAKNGQTLDETDPTGQKIRPMRYEEMSQQQQAVEDLKHSQAEMADANAALKRAQNDPSSPAFRLAQQRVNIAQQNMHISAGKLGLAQANYNARELGTDASGNELPGVLHDASGTPVGSAQASNMKPTAQERKTGDLAQSAVNQVHTMRQIVQSHPEIFGPVAGRSMTAQQWLGSQSPDAQTFLSASRYLADHSAGVFGSRSVEITKSLEQLTSPNTNSAAMNAALDRAESTAQHFVERGNMPTSANSNRSNQAPEGTVVKTAQGNMIKRGSQWVKQ